MCVCMFFYLGYTFIGLDFDLGFCVFFGHFVFGCQ